MIVDGGPDDVDDNLIVFPGGRRLRPKWMSMAACTTAGSDNTDLFFSGWKRDQEKALAICHACPVEDVCLQHAVEHGEDEGIWGGTTEAERKALRNG